MKTRCHQSYIILLPVYILKHLLRNASHQNFENENSFGELKVNTITCKYNIAHFFVNKHYKKISKIFSKIQDHTHTLLHKPAFIPKFFSSKLRKRPFADHVLIIGLGGSFFMMRCSKTSLVEKNKLCRKWSKKMEI